ncbi:MAG: site-specific integrase [Bacteroidales bacterium]|nr:site-specific integrase [Bacteroidales bacterium]MBQ8809564.1 site-specific integrase [Bacteroidales bacterium]
MPSKLKKRGNSYLLTVVRDGKEYTKTVRTTKKSEAEKEWTIFASEVLRDRVVAKSEGHMTLDQFYAYWLKNYAELHLEPSTIETRRRLYARIGESLGQLKLCNIRKRHVLEFVKNLSSPTASFDGKPLSTIYIKNHITLLTTLLNHAIDWDFIATNPALRVKIPGTTTPKEMPSEADFAKLLSLVDEHHDVRFRLWVALAFTLGLRKEEIFGLKWGDISSKILSVNRAAVYIHRTGVVTKPPKSKRSQRTLPLSLAASTLLYEWKKTYAKKFAIPTDDSFVFPNPIGGILHPSMFNYFLNMLCDRNNLPRITPHSLRHMYGTYLLAGGVNIATISSLMGHANSAFTLSRYVHELKSLEEQTASIMDNTLLKLTHK